MDFDIYLSEMSISNRHGGGLTMQRVIGPDLDRIGTFIHTSRFALDFEPAEKYAAKSKMNFSWFESDGARRLLGSRVAYRIAKSLTVQRSHARRLSQSIHAECRERNDLHVLTAPQGRPSLLVLDDLCSAANVDYVTWIMDDHLLFFRDGAWSYRPIDRLLIEKHLLHSECVLVISPALGEFYKKEFGVDYRVLFGPADPTGEPLWVAPNKRVKLGYFGSIGNWQIDALTRLARLLDSVGATLDIFSTSHSTLPISLGVSGVSLKGSLDCADVINEMRKYDAVVLPIGFDDSVRNLTEFNIATKMSECLASGTATLVVGPSHAAMIKFLQQYHCAWIDTVLSKETLLQNISSLMTTDDRVRRLQNARTLVMRELSIAAMRKVWASVYSSYPS